MRQQRYTLLAFFLVALALPFVVHSEYLVHIGVLILFYVLLATSFNLVVGYVGELPLGHTAFFGIGAYSAAMLSDGAALPLYLTIPLAGIIASLFGLLIGGITLRLRGPFFVIITLAFAETLRITAINWVGFTNGPMGFSDIAQPEWITAMSVINGKKAYYFVALALSAIVLYASYRLVNSGFGRGVNAVRENRFVAQSIGISPYHYALTVFVIAALIAGSAGGFYAHYITFVGPEVFAFPFMISMILIVLIGGKGTLVGPVLGAIVIVVLEEYLRDLKEFRLSAFGLVVIAVVIFLPNGLLGHLRKSETYKEGGAS